MSTAHVEARPGGAPELPSALTAEQEQAAGRRSEPLLLAAGAGSGKTSVLVERFVRAVLQDGTSAGRILAITFTERAAGELRERVRTRLLELGAREAARDSEAAVVGTFHGFCARILRAHPIAAGVDPAFTILDEPLARALQERAFREALAAGAARGGAELEVLAAEGFDGVQAMLAGVYGELRSRGERHPRLPVPQAGAGEEAAVAAVAALDRLLAGFAQAYERCKRERGALDFDDLELLAGDLLANGPRLRAAWSERFELLMVDEFQDTNRRQLAILRALDRGNLFTVGDELQSIYGFRHAEVELFRERRRELEPAGRALQLSANFRSRPELLRFVTALFAGRIECFAAPAAGRGDEDPSQPPAVELLLAARTGRGEGERAGGGAPGWRRAEAALLAGRIGEIVRAGEAAPGEVAVLLRAMGDVDVYERALAAEGLPTLAMVGGFWGRLETRDLLTYLRVLANPLDEHAVYELLSCPLGGAGPDTLAAVARAARALRVGAWEAAGVLATGGEAAEALEAPAGAGAPPPLPEGARAAVAGVRALVEAERAEAPVRPIAELIERAVHASRYDRRLLAMENGRRRLANLHKLLRLARRWEAAEGRDLRAFLEHVERLRDGGAEPDAPAAGEVDAVRLMTIHAAKGLEFPVVAVADLARTPNMTQGRLLVDGGRVGLRLSRLDGGGSEDHLAYAELAADRKHAQAHEEDRILYVAMTRARERLLLSGAIRLEDWPRTRAAGPPVDWIAAAVGRDAPPPAALPADSIIEVAGEAGPARVRCLLARPGEGAPMEGEASERTGAAEIRLRRAAPAGGAGAPGPAHGAPTADGAHAPDAGAHAPDAGAHAPQAGAIRLRRGSPPERAADPMSDPAMLLAGGAALSYTSLGELEGCGYRWYLRRVLGLPEVPEPRRREGSRAGLEARERGVLVHLLLERARLAGPPPTEQEVQDAAGELGLQASAEDLREALALIAGALACPTAERAAAAPQARREHSFAFGLGPQEPLITGVIDLLASDAGGAALVIDYKTDRVSEGEDLAAAVERGYGLQRLIYAIAALREGASEVEVVHWYLERPREPVGARFVAAELPALQERLLARVHAARERGFAVTSAPYRGLCAACPGRGGLCSWTDAHTLRPDPAAPPLQDPRGERAATGSAPG